MKEIPLQKLSDVQQKLLLEAERAITLSYAPYSNYRVGAALLTLTHSMISAANVENAALGSTICSERSAILRANAMGERKFEAIAITSEGRSPDPSMVAAPCGSCRQMLLEFAQLSGIDLEIIMASQDKKRIIVSTISELLPLGFGPRNMGLC